jgi:hypothetical protein
VKWGNGSFAGRPGREGWKAKNLVDRPVFALRNRQIL